MKRFIMAILGVILMLVGVAGLILPILPGWPIFFVGLSCIAPKLAERLKKRLLRKLFKSDIVWLDEWKKLHIQAGFTTKHFPLVVQKTDELLLEYNQKKFIELFSRDTKDKKHPEGRPLRSKFILMQQVHGDHVEVIDDAQKYSKDGIYHLPQCDGAITNVKGLTLLVFTADCLSIFFSAGSWVGLAHAGWKGTDLKIAKKTLKLLLEKSGANPKGVKIIFGPSIGVCHYEVGSEFKGRFPESSLKYYGKGAQRSLHFDLVKENRRQLVKSKVPGDNITDYGICTFAENDSFYSYRKEKEKAGRIVSFIQKY